MCVMISSTPRLKVLELGRWTLESVKVGWTRIFLIEKVFGIVCERVDGRFQECLTFIDGKGCFQGWFQLNIIL